MSIKRKVTLWYTLLMLIVTLIISMFIYSAATNFMEAQSRNLIEENLEGVESLVTYTKDGLTYSPKLSEVNNGVYLSVYDGSGNLIRGNIPKGFSVAIGQESMIKVNNYFYQDKLIEVNGYGNMYVRAILSVGQSVTSFQAILVIFLVSMPLFVMLIAVGGYIVTRGALKPVEKIYTTVKKITNGNDLSQRILLGEGKDEIHELASVFDSMLEKLERDFTKQKQFTSDISHEMRTPISIVILKVERILLSETLNQREKEELEVVLQAAVDMKNIMTQMLELAKLEDGKVELDFEEVEIGELINYLLKAHEHLKIQLHNEVNDLKIVSDRSLLIRIIDNLIENSIKHGKNISDIWVRSSEDKDNIYLHVTDNGVGIEASELELIFERFYQVDEVRTKNKWGSHGLGLSMVKWMVEILNYEIKVTSTPNIETTFTIIINK